MQMVQTKSPARTGPGMVRLRGWILVALGVALVLTGIGLIAAMAPTLLAPGQSVGGTTFTGSAAAGVMTLLLFGAVGLFGAVALAGGWAMVRTAQRPRWLVWVMPVVVLLLIFLGSAVMSALKQAR